MEPKWLMLHTWAGNLGDVPMTENTTIVDYTQIKQGHIAVIQSGPHDELLIIAKTLIESNWCHAINFKPDLSMYGIKHK